MLLYANQQSPSRTMMSDPLGSSGPSIQPPSPLGCLWALPAPRLGLAGSPANSGDAVLPRPAPPPPSLPLTLWSFLFGPRPLRCGLLLHHRPALLGLAGPLGATARLLGPGPELSLVPRRWTSRWLLAGGPAPPPARRVEAVRTDSPFHPAG